MSYNGKQLGKIYREKLANHLQGTYGRYTFKGQQRINFSSIRFLVLYSKYYEVQGKYWYGIGREEWEDWQDNEHLILLMPRAGYISEISPIIKYLDIPPGSLRQLVPLLSQDNTGQKNWIYTAMQA